MLLATVSLGVMTVANARCVVTYKIVTPAPNERLASPYSPIGKACGLAKKGDHMLVPMNINDTTRVASYSYSYDGIYMNFSNNKHVKVYKVKPSLDNANYFSFE